MALEQFEEVIAFVGAAFEFDACIYIFGVFAEHDHVDLLGVFHRRFDAVEITYGAQANEKVKILAKGNIQAPDAAADGCGQRPLDANQVTAEVFDCFVGKP